MKPIRVKFKTIITTAEAKAICPPPKGATHFCFRPLGYKPVFDELKNLDTLGGCEGTIEYGRSIFEGNGKQRKLARWESYEPPVPTVEGLMKENAKLKKTVAKYAKLLLTLLEDGIESELVNKWDTTDPESNQYKGDYYWDATGDLLGVNQQELEEATK